AMACAVPVICSRIGGTADMITDGENGLLVDQRDVGGLAAAMSRLATDTDFHARVGRAARERALRVFDYRVTAGMLASALGQQ
ncbi:MAG TPA: glycosyltransferase, partial [Polyangiaceae bacterium]